MKKPGVKISVPLVIGHFTGQEDLLGVAMGATLLEVVVTPNDAHTAIHLVEQTGFTKAQRAENLGNLALNGAELIFPEFDESEGIDMKIHLKIKGLASVRYRTALSIAGIYAINELFRGPYTDRELLATFGEYINANSVSKSEIGATLLGGMIISDNTQNNDLHRLIIQKGIHLSYLTNVDLSDSEKALTSYDTRIISSLIHGLAMSKFDYIRNVLSAEIKHAPSGALEVMSKLEGLDILGGIYLPVTRDIVVLTTNSLVASTVDLRMRKYFKKPRSGIKVVTSMLDLEGISLE